MQKKDEKLVVAGINPWIINGIYYDITLHGFSPKVLSNKNDGLIRAEWYVALNVPKSKDTLEASICQGAYEFFGEPIIFQKSHGYEIFMGLPYDSLLIQRLAEVPCANTSKMFLLEHSKYAKLLKPGIMFKKLVEKFPSENQILLNHESYSAEMVNKFQNPIYQLLNGVKNDK